MSNQVSKFLAMSWLGLFDLLIHEIIYIIICNFNSMIVCGGPGRFDRCYYSIVLF